MCGDVAILPQEEFYAVNWRQLGRFFEAESWPEVAAAVAGRSGAHLWGSHSRGRVEELLEEVRWSSALTGGGRQPLLRLASRHCPVAYRALMGG